MNSKAASIILAAIMIIGLASAVITVIPAENASKINYIGYKSHCTFTPFSTIISLAISLIAFLIAKRFVWR